MNIKRAISTALAVILVVTPHPQEVSAASFCQEYHLLKDTYNAWASRDDVVKLLGVNPDSHTFDDIYSGSHDEPTGAPDGAPQYVHLSFIRIYIDPRLTGTFELHTFHFTHDDIMTYSESSSGLYQVYKSSTDSYPTLGTIDIRYVPSQEDLSRGVSFVKTDSKTRAVPSVFAKVDPLASGFNISVGTGDTCAFTLSDMLAYAQYGVFKQPQEISICKNQLAVYNQAAFNIMVSIT